MTAAMLALEIVASIIDPNGVTHDVTSMLDLDHISSVQESLEDDMLELTHSDMDLTLHDPAGGLTELLRNSARSETWEFTIERRTNKRRNRWELIFAGMLDVPLSVEIDRKAKTVSMQAFSYSKLLDTIDVDSLRYLSSNSFPETVKGQKASCPGTTFVTLDPGFSSKLLRNGDIIVLDDGVNREEATVSVQHLTNVLTVVHDFQNSYTDANIELLTPWPRHQTIKEAAESLLDLVGVDFVEVDIENVKASIPFASGYDPDGIAQVPNTLHSYVPQTVVDPDNEPLSVFLANARYDSTSPSSGFTNAGVQPQEADWTAYLSARPGSLETIPANVQNGDGADTQLNSSPVPDDGLDWVAAYDHEGGDTFTLRHDHAPVSDDPRIRLFRNGTLVVGVASETGADTDQYHTAYLDWFERSAHGFDDDIAVVSTQAHNGTRRLDIVDLTAGTASTLVTGDDGGGGGVRTLGDRGQVAIQAAATDDLNQRNIPSDINLWKPAADGTWLEIDRTISDQPVMQMWTMRSFGDFIACMYLADSPTEPSSLGFQKRSTRARVWRWDTLEQIADFQVAPYAHPQMFSTRLTLSGVESYVAAVYYNIVVISTEWVGTIPYMNLDDIGGSRALKDIAVATLSYVNVDPYKVAHITGRGSNTGVEHEFDPETFIEHQEQPLSDSFLASVEVTGKDRSGQDFTVVVGDKHDSAERASIDSSLIRDTGLAEAIGRGYFSLMGGEREEHNIEIPLGDDTIRANDIVIFGHTRYRVIESDTDFDTMLQRLRVIEIVS